MSTAIIIIIIVTLSILPTIKCEYVSIYVNCNEPNNYCFGVKGTESDAGDCDLKTKSCNVVVHATKLAKDDVTITIATKNNSWVYVGFTREKPQLAPNNIPMVKDGMMEMWDYKGWNFHPKNNVSYGFSSRFVSQGPPGFKDCTEEISGAYGKVDTSQVIPRSGGHWKVYKFKTTTKPKGLSMDFEKDPLVPFIVGFTNGTKLTDKFFGTPRILFPITTTKGGGTSPVVPTNDTTDGGSLDTGDGNEDREGDDSEEQPKKGFPWWWIVLGVAVVLLIVGALIYIFCFYIPHHKKKKSVIHPRHHQVIHSIRQSVENHPPPRSRPQQPAPRPPPPPLPPPPSTASHPPALYQPKNNYMHSSQPTIIYH